MGGYYGFPTPSFEGAKTLAKKFGQGVKATRTAATSLGQAVDSAGSAIAEGAGEMGDAFREGAGIERPTLADKIGNAVPRPTATLSRPGQAAKPVQRTEAPTLAAKVAADTGRGVQPSTLRGAYRDSPGFGNFGASQPRSLAQMIQDEEASRILDSTYGSRMQANEAMAPDYQGDALKARLRDAEYEANSQEPRPVYTTGDTLGSFFKEKNGTITNTPAGPTLKQQFQIQQDRLKNAGGLLELGRGQLASELQTYRERLDRAVKTGTPLEGSIKAPTEAEADAMYAEAVRRAQELSGIMKSGYPPADQFGGYQGGGATLGAPGQK